MTIHAEENFNLREVYDRILDGELEGLVDPNSVTGPDEGGALFGAGGGRIPKITIQLKSDISDAEKTELMAKLRAMFGTKAHIHMDA